MRTVLHGTDKPRIRHPVGLRWRRALFGALLAVVIPTSETAALSMPPKSGASIGWKKGRQTGLPIPRFVSLKAQNARMRIGPSLDYAVKWIYTAPGLPIEIIEEYGNWREIRDCDGISGWMHRSLLSGQRTAVIGPWKTKPVALYAGAQGISGISALLAPRVRLRINACKGDRCNVSVPKHNISGFVDRSNLWGIYPAETISN